MSTLLIDRITAVVIFVISLFFYNLAKDYPRGAADFPTMVLGVLFVLAILLFLLSFKKELTIKIKKKKEKVILPQLLSIIFLSIIYCYLISRINYFIVTPLFIIFSMYALKVRNFKLLIAIPVGTTIVLFLVFKTLLNVPLPT